jgi:hypothetical protein
MEQLDDVVGDLRQFDRWRRKAALLRDQGCEALLESLAPPSPGSTVNPWPVLGDDQLLEKAEVLKALLYHQKRGDNYEEKVSELTAALEKVTREQALQDDPDHVPVLRSAKALCALAAAPDSAFSASVMYFMYVIVREIFVIRRPEWAVGGAGAGDGLSPNGFVTWQCVRAVSDFQTALNQTASLIREVAEFVTGSTTFLEAYVNGQAPSGDVPEDPWEVVDEPRRVLSFVTSVELLRANIALKLDSLSELKDEGVGAVATFIAKFRADLKKDISTHRDQFVNAEKQLDAFRKAERTNEDVDAIVRNRIRWSETAHAIACQTVKDAASYAERALAAFEDPPHPKELHKLADHFTKAAGDFDTLLRAVKAHVSRSLDTQLAAAALPGSGFEWDPGEMAFAAAAYVEISPADQRIRRAAQHLLGVMGETGMFPLGNPVRTTQHQYTLHAQNAEVIRALAVVLEKAGDIPFQPAHAERMLAYLSDGAALSGWISGTDGVGSRSRRAIAAAVLALARVNRMLDERINEEVFRFFSVKRPEHIRTHLRDLFYPDYGFVYVSRPSESSIGTDGAKEDDAPIAGTGDDKDPSGGSIAPADTPAPEDGKTLEDAMREKNGIYRRESIAVVLEKMRAHVRRAPSKREDPTFSLVLHGPPGTGKTTLVESLAKTCDVPLVEVTPSDIVIGGAEKMEARARAVFEALSLLTRAVILFDEFDPVILKRNPEEKNPSVFSFLTPGMLPKLKTLHEQAEKRSVAYVLVTNLIAKLDEAAIREGRFDLRIGIYPPDVLSRYGRIRRVAEEYASKVGAPEGTPSHDRIWATVKKSRGGSMTTMGKPGWFSAPRGEHDVNPANAFGYIFGSQKTVPEPPREARLNLPALPPDVRKKLEDCGNGARPLTSSERRLPNWCSGQDHQGQEDHATREYKEWAWVVCWDYNLAHGLASPADVPGVPAKLPDPAELQRCFCAALEEMEARSARPSG